MEEMLYPGLEENREIYMGRKSKTSNNTGIEEWVGFL